MKIYHIMNISYVPAIEYSDPIPEHWIALDMKENVSYFYPTRDAAEDELLRLAEKYPGENFHLFESVANVMERGAGKDRVLYIEPQTAKEE